MPGTSMRCGGSKPSKLLKRRGPRVWGAVERTPFSAAFSRLSVRRLLISYVDQIDSINLKDARQQLGGSDREDAWECETPQATLAGLQGA